MFNLNRDAKYESCTKEHHKKIYALKNKFIEKLYQGGYALATWGHVVKSELLECNHCDGTGICERNNCKYGCATVCELCHGEGKWFPPERFCFRFEIGNQRYTWHQSEESVSFKPVLSEPPVDWDGIIEEKPINLHPRRFAEAKSLLRWVLDKM